MSPREKQIVACHEGDTPQLLNPVLIPIASPRFRSAPAALLRSDTRNSSQRRTAIFSLEPTYFIDRTCFPDDAWRKKLFSVMSLPERKTTYSRLPTSHVTW